MESCSGLLVDLRNRIAHKKQIKSHVAYFYVHGICFVLFTFSGLPNFVNKNFLRKLEIHESFHHAALRLILNSFALFQQLRKEVASDFKG